MVAPQRRHPPTTATCSSVSVPAIRGSPPAASALAGDRLYNHTLPCKRANDDNDNNNKHTDKVLAFAFSCALVYLEVLPPWSALLPHRQHRLVIDLSSQPSEQSLSLCRRRTLPPLLLFSCLVLVIVCWLWGQRPTDAHPPEQISHDSPTVIVSFAGSCSCKANFITLHHTLLCFPFRRILSSTL